MIDVEKRFFTINDHSAQTAILTEILERAKYNF